MRPRRRKAGRHARDHHELALLFRDLATLRTDAPVFESVDDWRWRGPAPALEEWAERLGAPGIVKRARRLAERRQRLTQRSVRPAARL